MTRTTILAMTTTDKLDRILNYCHAQVACAPANRHTEAMARTTIAAIEGLVAAKEAWKALCEWHKNAYGSVPSGITGRLEVSNDALAAIAETWEGLLP